jgi:GntR family transcriptional repressor for pyruvate dehydrogenase complex
METISSALYDGRRKTVGLSKSRKDSADLHHEIYRAIRRRNPAEAQKLMERHIERARQAQEDEERSVLRATRRGKNSVNGKIAV